MGILTVWIITWRMAWPFFLIAAVFLLLAAIAARTEGRLPPAMPIVLMLLLPFVVGGWGGANWASEEQLSELGWRSWTLLALGVLTALVAIYAPWRFRKAKRSWVLVLCAVNTMVLDLAFLFVGGMAIVNDWL